MKFKQINQVELNNKTVLIRTDMNVPIKDGKITDATRIIASAKTIEYALENGARVVVATHLGRPTEGEFSEENSIKVVAEYLANLLKLTVPVISSLDNPIDFSHTNIVMLENVRFNKGEKKNCPELGKKYANLCDIFVHDAFATAHRKEASTDAVGYLAPEVCAGLLMSSELKALTQAIANPVHPVVAVVAGSKVSTKLTILDNLADKVDYLIVGGGILNTFMLANQIKIGKSLAEVDLVSQSQQVMAKMKARNASVPLPNDVVVAQEFSNEAQATTKTIDQITDNDMILDIGNKFANQLAEIIKNAGTVIWNGPVGVFEFEQFANGTAVLANSIANSQAFSLAGGGDTIAAINKFGLMDKISYVSTAGGALLEFLEGKTLPAIELFASRA